ncbi:MAG: ribE [Firmicutes bacterium]|nr:ribE [Bacillota bacterium]
MFTGLIEEMGKVKDIARGTKSVRITITASKIMEGTVLGDSIAVNGTCLTVVAFGTDWFTADVMPETVDRTVLSKLKAGDKVNLERTLRVGDRLGGHIVSGHVDGIGTINEKKVNDIALIVKITAKPEILRYIIQKGSIAIDGISLTVVDCGPDWFTVSLIPHSAAMTTLGYKSVGEIVNLEVDMIGKYVEKFLGLGSSPAPAKSDVSLAFLQENGFF